MKTYFSIKHSFLLGVCLSVGLSSTQTQAFKLQDYNPLANPKLTARRLAFATGIIAVIRLANKENAKEDRMTVEKAIKKLKKETPFSKKWFELLHDIVDDIVIGFKGKESGKLKPIGSKLFVTGQDKSIGSHIMPDGTRIELYKFEGVDPYGVMGTLYTKLKPAWGLLKDLKDGKESFDYWANKAQICP